MELRPGDAQWIGRRGDQQDAFGFAGFAQDGGRGGVLAVLADGLGGLRDGGPASRLAVQRMLAVYDERRPDEPPVQILRRALGAANRAVYELACGSAGAGKMGTTLVAALVQGDQLYWVSVGDSRLYLYRGADGSVVQCTQDHNYRNELLAQVAAGRSTREAAETAPSGEALTSFIGIAAISYVDFNLRPLTLFPGDRVLLCSDGVHGVLSATELASALRQEAQAGAAALLDAVKAKALAGQDNATVALIACEPEPGPAQIVFGAAEAAPLNLPPRWRGRLALLLGLPAALAVGFWIGRELMSSASFWFPP